MNKLTVHKFGVEIPLKSLAEVRFQSPRVTAIKEQDLFVFLVKRISEVYFKCGTAIDAGELKAISTAFQSELVLFPYITLSEIEKCFNEGYKERYGKYYGLSVKTFVGWIDYYIQNVRNEHLHKTGKQKTKQEQNEMSEDEKQKYISSGMARCLNYYEEKGKILEGYSTFIYDVFYDDGFLPTDKETKQKFYNDAKEFLHIFASGEKPNSLAHLRELKQVLEEISKPKSNKVIIKAQEMIVLDFLRRTYNDDNLVIELKEKYNCK